jgi:hypothetical protein
MADPLSITASIIAVLQLASSVAGYLRDVKDASNECKRLALELSTTRGILDALRDTITEIQDAETWSATFHTLGHSDGPLQQLKTVLLDLESKLSKAASAQNFKKLTKSLIWPFKKVGADEIIRSIERQKALLGLALDNDQLRLSQSIKDDTVAIRDTMQFMHDDVKVAVEGIANLNLGQSGKVPCCIQSM